MAKNNGFEPTAAQRNAIEASGGAVTVSAAAGSGKTRVLVQRVIRHLTEEGIPADRLLILTFTNTAAQEMRTRISRAIDDLIADDPSNDLYRRQQLLLYSADICTIDSFCSKMVRENFFRLGISKDYRIGSETELNELRRRIMSDLIEEYYKQPEGDTESEEYKKALSQYEAFNTLSITLTDPKLDSDLEKRLLDAYDKYSAHAFPELWMEHCVKQYDPEMDISDSPAARYLVGSIRPYLKKLRAAYDNASVFRSYISETAGSKKTKAYISALDALDSYEYFIEGLEDVFEDETVDIDKITEVIRDFEKISIRVGGSKDQDLKDCVSYLNEFADIVTDNMKEYAIFTSDEFKRSNEKCMPVILCLKKLLEEYDDRFFTAKTEKGIMDFHDLERLMLRLLYEKNDEGRFVRSEYAKELSEIYEEIMVDEYQDTNDIQESIFRAISKNEENLFVVGDIKQSIYRFRDAQPELFKRRCTKSVKYDEKSPEFPALIVLDKNFRSRSGIIDSVNYMFSMLMSDEAGDIDYDEDQRLTAGAVYPEKDDGTPDTEVHMIVYTDEKNDDSGDESDASIDSTYKAEAIYCAGLIKKMVSDGVKVTESGVLRDAKYSDFCILLRAVRNKAHIYSEQLKKSGIPACTDTDFDLLQRYEIRAALSYLKILNNPLSDVDIAASLLCPVFGFTPDEVSELKDQKEKRYYKKLYKKSLNEDDLGHKCRAFLDDLRYFRTYSLTAQCDVLLMEIFEKMGFYAAVSTMQDGAQRVQNLRRLIGFAAEYESTSGGGLSGFVRHIRYLEETGSGIKVSDSVPDNAVRIMTIHHSKGLEFPICILAGTKTSKPNTSECINFHPDFGIGLRAVDDESFLQYNTLQHAAIEAADENEEKSEQMRVLYVAMTRAKEKLIILSSIKGKSGGKDDEKYIQYLMNIQKKCVIDEEGKFLPFNVMSCRNYSDWIMMCLMCADKLSVLRGDADIETVPSPDMEYRLCTELKSGTQETAEKIMPEPSPELKQKINDIFKRGEIQDIDSFIPSKVSASMLAHKGMSSEFVAAARPAFARKEKISPTQRGLATHAFLQYADFHALKKEIDETGAFFIQKQKVVENGNMTKEQTDIIEDKSIIDFVRSDLFKAALSCKKLYREYRFTVELPDAAAVLENSRLKEMLKESPNKISPILQGAIDCMIEDEDGIIIIDYKTDRVKEPSVLAEMYGVQLELYKSAAEKLFEKPVKACYIYSLHCGKEVQVRSCQL